MQRELKRIVLSIKPVFSDEIYKGNKGVELRRSLGTQFVEGAELLIYSTNPQKAITGAAEIKKIEQRPVSDIVENYLSNACIDHDDCVTYFKGKEFGYLIWLTNVRRYKDPLHLSDLKEVGFTAPQSFSYASQELVNLVNRKCQ